MDSQSVRWGDNCSLNGIGGNKKIKGIKRHVVVDKNDFLLAVIITITCVHDSRTAYLLVRYLREICCNIKIIDELTFDSTEEMVKLTSIRMLLNKI